MVRRKLLFWVFAISLYNKPQLGENAKESLVQKVFFKRYYSVCNEMFNQTGQFCRKYPDIIACRTTINNSEIIHCSRISKTGVSLRNGVAYQTLFPTSAYEEMSLKCRLGDQSISITAVTYKSYKNYSTSCSQRGEMNCTDVLKGKCNSKPCANEVETLDTSREACEYTDKQVEMATLEKCRNETGYCNVSLPRVMLKNYDDCVIDDWYSAVNCSQAANRCYADWVEVSFNCENVFQERPSPNQPEPDLPRLYYKYLTPLVAIFTMLLIMLTLVRNCDRSGSIEAIIDSESESSNSSNERGPPNHPPTTGPYLFNSMGRQGHRNNSTNSSSLPPLIGYRSNNSEFLRNASVDLSLSSEQPESKSEVTNI